jgi:phospholipid transport system substrate-binding protein
VVHIGFVPWGYILRKLISSLILLVALSTSAQAVPCPADGFVQSAAKAYIGAARKGSSQAFVSAAARFTDLRRIAFFALGQYRRDLPRDHEDEYVALARNFMGRFMAQNSGSFSTSRVDIVSCAPGAGGLVVSAKLSGDKTISFRLRGSDGSYRVDDMSVSSVWLVQAMRNRFTRVISDHGGDVTALLDWLRN